MQHDEGCIIFYSVNALVSGGFILQSDALKPEVHGSMRRAAKSLLIKNDLA